MTVESENPSSGAENATNGATITAPPVDIDPVTLLSSLDDRIKKVRTRSQDISFGELLNMYKEGDLIIRPVYQRLFRWDKGRQSRFIESLALEMPVPPIFVIEDEEGRYELIDGLQRISSYLHFRGALLAPERNISPGDTLKLEDCDILTELNGLTYRDLPTALDLKLKRHFTRVEVIRKESDPSLRYHMFKRLNTGGELLSEQELRNCTIRMLGSQFIDLVAELNTDSNFRIAIQYVNPERIRKLYDQELVLRFFAFKNWTQNYIHEIGEFLTEYMEAVTTQAIPFDYDREGATFRRTFLLLAKSLGPDVFARSNDKGTFVQSFSPIHFDAIVTAIQPFLPRIDPTAQNDLDALAKVLGDAKRSSPFRNMTTGGGLNFAKLAQERTEYCKRPQNRLFSLSINLDGHRKN